MTRLIARVFPRITKATPRDELAFYGPPDLFTPSVDEVHISTTFTWDKPKAEWLAEQWQHIAPVKVDGPAYRNLNLDFTPGQYLGDGYVITSRGCPQRCWFCDVWKKHPEVHELPIHEGWMLQDDNILACSESHFRAVFDMLKRQPHQPHFYGGLEPSFLKDWHVDLFAWLKPKQMFFAYDTPDDLEPLIEASKMLREAGFSRNQMRCYVLIGWPKDTMELAEIRLQKTLELGFFPFAMLWKNDKGMSNAEWRKFQRQWARPASISAKASAQYPNGKRQYENVKIKEAALI